MSGHLPGPPPGRIPKRIEHATGPAPAPHPPEDPPPAQRPRSSAPLALRRTAPPPKRPPTHPSTARPGPTRPTAPRLVALRASRLPASRARPRQPRRLPRPAPVQTSFLGLLFHAGSGQLSAPCEIEETQARRAFARLKKRNWFRFRTVCRQSEGEIDGSPGINLYRTSTSASPSRRESE